MNKLFVLHMFFFILTCSVSASVISDRSGIIINESISGKIEQQKRNIEGEEYIKYVLPEGYSREGRYPETEYFERSIYFAAPEGSTPRLKYSVNASQKHNVSELVPSAKFTIGSGGIVSEEYAPAAKRNDREFPHSEIVFFGYMNGMNLYKIIVRPLVFKGGEALLASDFNLQIIFDKKFENTKSESVKTSDSFEAGIINLDYAKSNPVRQKKATVPNFLDHQTEWIKLKIKDEGIYKITAASVRNLGLDLTSALCGMIKVYSSAGEDIPNDPTQPVYHGAKEISRRVVDSNGNDKFDENDYIVFYAVQTTQRDSGSAGHYYNKYSENTYYWIDLGIGSLTGGRDIGQLSESSQYFSNLSVFERHTFSELRNALLYRDYMFQWYYKKVDPLQSTVLEFNMKNIDESYPVTLKVHHSTDIVQPSTKIKYTINYNSLSDTVSTKPVLFKNDYNSSFFTANSVNSFRMTNLQPPDPEHDMTRYCDGFDVIYHGSVNAGSSDEYFYADMIPFTFYRLNLGNSTGRELFDISDPFNVRSSVLDNDYCPVLANKEFNSYLLFSNQYKTPAEMKIYDNTSVSSLHSRSVQADMVIISPPDFYNFFKNDEMDYIKTHLESGRDVSSIEVVNMDQISDEFGRGYQEPAATRNFIKYAYDNWGTEYVLLAGDGNYYIKNEQNIPEKNYIYPPDVSYNDYSGQGSDHFYSNLYSSVTAQHVALGRFTVSSLTELRNVVSKTIFFIKNSNLSSKKSKILLVADDERSLNGTGTWYDTVHIRNSESIIVPRIPEYYYCDKLYSTEYPFEFSAATTLWLKPTASEELVRKLQNGVNLFCYVGHGAPLQLAHERLYDASAFSKLNNYENYFFMIGATCSFGVFNDPNTKYLAEKMLISANKGSIGLINSVAPVYSGPNESLVGQIFSSAFFDPVNKLTIGKAFKNAKNLQASSNSSCYMLLGDPALMFFNDQTIVESDSSVELQTLVLDSINSALNTSLSGNVTDNNGFLNTIIVDSEVRRAYFNEQMWDHATDLPLQYDLPGKVILSTNSTINNGVSVAEFILPKDLTYGDNKGKVLFYGHNAYGEEFTGSINSVSIRGDAAVTITDSIPPEIRICYNSLNYIQGDPIGQSPLVFAEIYDDNGINTSGGIGHKIIMEIDGTATDVTPYFNYDTDNYKKGHTSYQPADLSPGKHNIKITAWDTFNNYSEKTETFEVIKESDKAGNRIGNLLNYPNPVKNKGTTFGFAVDSPTALESFTVSVYTVNGRKIKVIDDTAVSLSDEFQQCSWDGKDADGDKPANGVYIYVLSAKFSDGKTINKKGKLIFAR